MSGKSAHTEMINTYSTNRIPCHNLDIDAEMILSGDEVSFHSKPLVFLCIKYLLRTNPDVLNVQIDDDEGTRHGISQIVSNKLQRY